MMEPTINPADVIGELRQSRDAEKIAAYLNNDARLRQLLIELCTLGDDDVMSGGLFSGVGTLVNLGLCTMPDLRRGEDLVKPTPLGAEVHTRLANPNEAKP